MSPASTLAARWIALHLAEHRRFQSAELKQIARTSTITLSRTRIGDKQRPGDAGMGGGIGEFRNAAGTVQTLVG